MPNTFENYDRKIKIERATPKDVKGMQEVFYKTWLDTYPNEEAGVTVDDIEDRFKNTFSEESLKRAAERIKGSEDQETLFFAKDGEKVIGVCRVVKTEESNRLQAIYVLPEYQGRGVGKSLWDEAEKVFDKDKGVVVAVATYNDKAIEFYKRLGFEDSGRRFKDDRFKMKSGSAIPEMEMVMEAKNSGDDKL